MSSVPKTFAKLSGGFGWSVIVCLCEIQRHKHFKKINLIGSLHFQYPVESKTEIKDAGLLHYVHRVRCLETLTFVHF